MASIELVSVSKTFGGRRILKDFSLGIARGERVVLRGPSGCGKTTILRLIAGLETLEAGQVFLRGRLVAKAGRNLVEPEHRKLGMVFQDLALWPHMSVARHLEFALRYAEHIRPQERADAVRDMLQLTQLSELRALKPGELSGGQQQRVGLARALVAHPDILLMDEPLSSLDEHLRENLRDEISRLHDKLGFTLLFVTHDPREATGLAARTVELQSRCDGRTA